MGLLGRDGYWSGGFEYEPHPDHCKETKDCFIKLIWEIRRKVKKFMSTLSTQSKTLGANKAILALSKKN